MTPDAINAAFELVGAGMIWRNVHRVREDGAVRGVSWLVVSFWSVWGVWNLIYYPILGQWLSVAAGAVLVLANTTWVVLMLRALRREGRGAVWRRA